MYKSNRRRICIALAHGLGAVAMTATTAHAQRIEKIEVTGSNI